MKRVLLDTNFLIDLARFKIDIEEIPAVSQEPYKIFVPYVVAGELEKIASSRRKDSKFAKIAIEMIRSNKIKTVRSSGRTADEAFLNTANKNTIIATNDSELRKKLKGLRVKTVYLRARKHLEIG